MIRQESNSLLLALCICLEIDDVPLHDVPLTHHHHITGLSSYDSNVLKRYQRPVRIVRSHSHVMQMDSISFIEKSSDMNHVDPL